MFLSLCKRVASFCLPVILLSCLYVPAFAAGPAELISEAAVLMDAETGQVLYEKNMHEQLYPASITKIMTGMLALESLEPEQVLTVTSNAVDAVPRDSAHISLYPGQQMTVEQIMYALSLVSANDAANVLAEAVSGSLFGFADRMTEKARELGAVNTHFANANGLPDSNHYTTAYDMALITAAAIRTPDFIKYFGAKSYQYTTSGELHSIRTFTNKNKMITGEYPYEGVLMSKTGWTRSAQGTLVTAVRQGDTTLIAVVLKSAVLEDKYRDTVALLDYGFRDYVRQQITGEQIGQRLSLGRYEPMENQQISYLLPADASLEDVAFSLAPGMNLKPGAEQTAVVVKAKLGQMELPDHELILILQPEEPAPMLARISTAELPEEQPQPVASSPVWGVWAGAVIVLLCWAALSYRKGRKRRHRRLRLEARIRQMKKKME